MLFDAVEAEMRNARTAINNAGIYMDRIKDAVNGIEKPSRIEASLPVSSGDIFLDLMVKTESGEYWIPSTIKSDNKTIMYEFKIRGANKKTVSYSEKEAEKEAENLRKIRDVNKRLDEHQKALWQ